MAYQKSDIFTPYSCGHLTVRTRLVRSATEFFCATRDGHMIPFEKRAYEALGKQPLGLIITAHTCVSPEGRSNPYQNAMWDDSYTEDGREIVAATNGVPTVLQLGHGGMKGKGNNGGLPVLTPDTMTAAEIGNVVRAFASAARRAQDAGFSGVMLHTAHMYLLSQFFYPCYNHRTDGYGGNAENRFRITREILIKIKETCGADFPVLMKINGTDETCSEEYRADVLTALQIAESEGLDAAEISGWDSAPHGRPIQPYFLDTVSFLSRRTELPLIEVGGVRSTADILRCMDAGAKAVSLCRPLLREPQFPTRIRDEENAVSACVGCCKCFEPCAPDAVARCGVTDQLSRRQ